MQHYVTHFTISHNPSVDGFSQSIRQAQAPQGAQLPQGMGTMGTMATMAPTRQADPPGDNLCDFKRAGKVDMLDLDTCIVISGMICS